MLSIETRDRVRIVTLSRPEARNAVNPARYLKAGLELAGLL